MDKGERKFFEKSAYLKKSGFEKRINIISLIIYSVLTPYFRDG